MVRSLVEARSAEKKSSPEGTRFVKRRSGQAAPFYLRLSAVRFTFSSPLTEPALRAEVLNMRKKVKQIRLVRTMTAKRS
jgi:hypothetical protein